MRKKIGQQIVRLLALEDSAEQLALAFAIGVFLALTPFWGLHTILALGLAVIFGLNRAAILLGMFVNNPWTFVPYYTASTYLGGRLIGFPANLSLPAFGWAELWSTDFWTALFTQWRVLVPMAVGSTIMAFFFAFISYPAALYMIRRGRAALRRQTAAELPA
jgi:uncharacterized protein